MTISIQDTPLSNPGLDIKFKKGFPFPVLILDNFFPLKVVNGVIDEILLYQNFEKSNDYIFAKNKFENSKIENLGPNGSKIKDFLVSQEVSLALSTIYGREIFVDPNFLGGGLHRGGEGSYLDMHTDFNLHPVRRQWIRELNILLYLNEGWKSSYGGCLELKNKLTSEATSIEPIFNRIVLMQTKDFTLHGYKPINFPKGTFRTSIAAYAYSEASDNNETLGLRTTTTWAPDGPGVLKKVIAVFAPRLVTIKHRIFGSNTSRRK
jgi:hypothetical protein